MAALYKTQCPHCAAQFRISDQHLKQAKGAVRCGSCMLVFQADQHLVEIPEGEVKPPIRATQTSTSASWQDIDLSRNVDSKTNPHSPPPESEFSDSFLALTAKEYRNTLHDEDFSDMQGAAAADPIINDDTWAEDLLRELEESDDSSTDTLLPTALAEEQTNHQLDPTPEDVQPPHTEEESSEKELDDWLNEGLLDELLLPEQPQKASPPPANIFSRPSINWWQQFKWTLLCLMLLVAFSAQFLYFNFGKVARTPEYRPFIAQFCELAGCQLPSMSNLNRIRSQHLVIRNHPENEDALQVDALLYNLAEHEQPYPNLGLEFSNKQGDIVASRLFKPSEYLSGNLKGATSMPPSTPIRISLTLINPGSDAINHRLQFYPPDNPNSP